MPSIQSRARERATNALYNYKTGTVTLLQIHKVREGHDVDHVLVLQLRAVDRVDRVAQPVEDAV